MPRHSLRTCATILATVALAAPLAACDQLGSILEQDTYGSGSSATAPTAEDDYYTIDGTAEHPYNVTRPGEVEYCPTDKLDRAVCAYGELTSSLRDQAQHRGRQDINVDPTGWGHNAEVTIPAMPDQDGSEEYHGWLFNRSHLVADSLGGDPTEQNLVTGTRTQNVGSHQEHGQYAGGMAYTELIARDYLDEHDGDACPLYYAATPHYDGDDLVPTTVTVDIKSCNGKIDQHVVVANTAEGIDIDYATGKWSQN